MTIEHQMTIEHLSVRVYSMHQFLSNVIYR